MTPAQDAESYRWPALEPAAWLEEQMTFCRCGNLLTDRNVTGQVRRQLPRGGGGMTDHAAYAHPACCGVHYTQRPGGHCDWTCCPHEPEFIPRALRCACTDTHHYRGSALCPLTPVDPWGETP